MRPPSSWRDRILTLLAAHPEGLKLREIAQALNAWPWSTPAYAQLGAQMRKLCRDGRLYQAGSHGRYYVPEHAPSVPRLPRTKGLCSLCQQPIPGTREVFTIAGTGWHLHYACEEAYLKGRDDCAGVWKDEDE